VFSFTNSMTNCGSANTGSVSPGPNANQCSVAVNVPTGNYVTVQLTGATDFNGTLASPSVTMGVLVGDTTANGVVNSSDIAQTQTQSGQTLTIDNFREDVTVSGDINSSDIALVQSQSGTGLPPSPSTAPAASPSATPAASSAEQTSKKKTRRHSSTGAQSR
jgi:hypothetical protein